MSHTSSRQPLRPSETVDVLLAAFEGRIKREGQGPWESVDNSAVDLCQEPAIKVLRKKKKTAVEKPSKIKPAPKKKNV